MNDHKNDSGKHAALARGKGGWELQVVAYPSGSFIEMYQDGKLCYSERLERVSRIGAKLLEGKRAPVQKNREFEKPAGTVSWEEHVMAWEVYARTYGNDQSAERIAERQGFCYGELVDFLGHAPKTWKPL